MKRRSFILLIVVMLLVSCSRGEVKTNSATPTAPVVSTATRELPTAQYRITEAPDAQSAARAFLDAWKVDDYPGMYGMLTSLTRDAIQEEVFVERYRMAAISMTLQSIEYEILSNLTNPSTAQVAYEVNYHTQVVGNLSRQMTMGLAMENGSWKVQWDDGLILPELKGGNTLAINYDAPARGNIYDRDGDGVAIYSEVVSLGIWVGQTDPKQEGTMLSVLSALTGRTPESIKASYEGKYAGDYVPVGQISKRAYLERQSLLANLAGVEQREYAGRFYPGGGIASHVTGYVSAIQPEEQDQYQRAGYMLSDRVGRSGLEKWGEKLLTGVKGATLDVYDPQGRPITRLAKVDRRPSQSIYMTIDADLQREAQKAMSGFKGGLVVIERDTGRVLAMVSSPEFDPNAFEFQNYNWQTLLSDIFSQGTSPEYNRASMDGYPLGSVFKIITLAATLESGVHTPEDTLNCGYEWTDPNGRVFYDWTYAKGYNPSGVLTLMQGLVRSCNPWFYQMGLDLFEAGRTKDVSSLARAFGLGSKTGIEGLEEAAGNIPDPATFDMAVQMAIGQGEILVNPLQVARFVAAIGNGGTLYRPQVIEKIVDPDGNPSFTFAPDAKGTLPVSIENMDLVRQAMRDVVDSPRGTAVRTFGGIAIPVFGKTGTAQSDPSRLPHAWFAGYTNAKRADKPDIAIAVIAENAGEGSEIAAPIFRRVLEVYFMGQPQYIYPWEAKYNVTKTPTSEFTETPTPPPSTPTPEPGVPQEVPGEEFNMRTATPAP
jgi:cell division protein FtsI/penicillin-binding protein 2